MDYLSDHITIMSYQFMHYSAVSSLDEDIYPSVIIGGTFDKLHNGHKLLLSTASLYSQKELYVGVTDGPMVENKTLSELMESTHTRISRVKRYLSLDVYLIK